MARELPKYQTVVNWIREQVISNRLTFGEKFYSENELSTMFGISRQTVRQAVGILEQEKIVERRRGSGTYVVYQNACTSRPRTGTIGVLSTYLDDYIFTNIIKGIETVLSQNGYSMQMAFTHNRVENEARALRAMLEKGVDGIIVEPTKSGLPNPNIAFYKQLHTQKMPLIFFNAYYPEASAPHVCMDDRIAGKLATEALLEAGHRRIAGIFQCDDLQGHLRYAGYLEAMQEAGVEINSENVLWYSTEDIRYLEEDFHRILRRIEGCTGLVCYNDQLAFRLVGQLRRVGLTVPERISLVGIDNSDLAAICEVPFASVIHPMQELGCVVAENMVKLIANPAFDATVEFAPTLMRRDSIKQIDPA